MDNCFEVSGCVLHCERASENVEVCVSEDGLNEVVRSHEDMEKGVYLILGECQTYHTLAGPPPALRELSHGMKTGTKITRACQHSHQSTVTLIDRTMIPPRASVSTGEIQHGFRQNEEEKNTKTL